MRYLSCALAPTLALLAAGCAPIGFDLSRTIDEQRITGDPVANTAGQLLPAGTIMPQSINVDLAAEGAARNVPVRRVFIKSLSFAITPTAEPAGDTDDFSFFRTVRMFLECTGSCSLARVEVASASGPGAVRNLAFTITPNVNVKPYLDAGARVVIEADAIPPPDDTTFNGQIVLRIEPF